MSIEGVNNQSVYSTTYTSSAKSGEKTEPQSTTATQTAQADGYEKSDNKSAGLYSPDYKKIARMWEQQNIQKAMVVDMMRSIAGGAKQDIGVSASLGAVAEGSSSFDYETFIKSFLDKGEGSGEGVQIDDATRSWAQGMVSDEGFYGAPQTSQRLLDFAVALAGSDSEKLGVMKDAIQKSFDEVAKMFGGFDNLPDVTKRTYEMTMKGFDELMNPTAPTEEAAQE